MFTSLFHKRAMLSLRLAQEAAKMEPTFKVATQIGWFDDVFVLPDRVYPPQPPMAGYAAGLVEDPGASRRQG